MNFITTIIRKRRTSQLLTIEVSVNDAKEMFNIMNNISVEEIEPFGKILFERYNADFMLNLSKVYYMENGAMLLELGVALNNLYVPNVADQIIEILLGHLSYVRPDSDEQSSIDFEEMEQKNYLDDYR